jgi:hypothetical protein
MRGCGGFDGSRRVGGDQRGNAGCGCIIGCGCHWIGSQNRPHASQERANHARPTADWLSVERFHNKIIFSRLKHGSKCTMTPDKKCGYFGVIC